METLRLISWHAGLDGNLDPESVSGALIGNATVEAAVRSVLGALQRDNLELNGSKPSEVIGEVNAAVPRGLAYAVAELARMLRDGGRDDEAWAVDTAWLAVLAGDIDDVAQHVASERLAGS